LPFFEGVFNNKKLLNANHRFYLKEISKKLYIGFKKYALYKKFFKYLMDAGTMLKGLACQFPDGNIIQGLLHFSGLFLVLSLCISPVFGLSVQDSIEKGASWLVLNQNADGSWDGGLPWSTAEAILALENQDYIDASDTIENGKSWISFANIEGTDFLSRKVLLIGANASSLVSFQNSDGGWGYSTFFSSNIIDTSLALEALKKSSPNSTSLRRGIAYLEKIQQQDGSFAPDNLYTALASQTLGKLSFVLTDNELIFNEDAYKAGYKSAAHLSENLGTLSGELELANALQALVYNGHFADEKENLVTALINSQNPDGSWGLDASGRAYTTSQCLLALQEYLKSSIALRMGNLIIKKDNSTLANFSIPAGEEYSLFTQISNLGENQKNIIIVGKVVQEKKIVKILPPKLIRDFTAGSVVGYSSYFVTDHLMPGAAYLIVEIRDGEGRVIHANQTELNVLPTQKVRIHRLEIIPSHADIKSLVNFYLDVENIGNRNISDAFIEVELLSPNQTVFWSSNTTATLNVGKRGYIKVGTLYTGNLAYGTYPVIARVYKDGALVEGGTTYSALSIGPRIRVERRISSETFPPGRVTATINVTIQGKTGKPPADVVILVDCTNLSTSALEDVKTALNSFVTSLAVGDRVAVVAVSNTTTVLLNLSTDRDAALSAISSITIGAPILKLGEGINRSVEILLENGRGDKNWYIFTVVRAPSYDDPLSAIEWAAENGIPVYMIIYSKEGENE
jgi:hypothetical protein